MKEEELVEFLYTYFGDDEELAKRFLMSIPEKEFKKQSKRGGSITSFLVDKLRKFIAYLVKDTKESLHKPYEYYHRQKR